MDRELAIVITFAAAGLLSTLIFAIFPVFREVLTACLATSG
jgi:hypothetical protein